MDFAPELAAYPIKTDGIDFNAAFLQIASNPEGFHQTISPEGWVTSVSLNPAYAEYFKQEKQGAPDDMVKYILTTSYHRGMGDFIGEDKPFSAVTTTAYITDPAHTKTATFADMKLYGYDDQSKFITVKTADDYTVTVRDENLSAHVVNGNEPIPFESLEVAYARGHGKQEPFLPIKIAPATETNQLPLTATQDNKPVLPADAIACANDLLSRIGMQDIADLPETSVECTLVPKLKKEESDTRFK